MNLHTRTISILFMHLLNIPNCLVSLPRAYKPFLEFCILTESSYDLHACFCFISKETY